LRAQEKNVTYKANTENSVILCPEVDQEEMLHREGQSNQAESKESQSERRGKQDDE
jgi:hypothetical protein